MDGIGWQRFAAAVACASLVGAAACGRNDRNATDSATAAGDVARADSAASATAPAAAPGATATTPSASTSTLSITGGDPEILQVLAVVDQGEVQDGQLAQRQARSARVKAFARELVAAHTKSLQQDRQLAKSNNVQLPTPSGTTGTSRPSASGTTSTPGVTDTSRSAASAAAPMSAVATQLQQQHMQMMEQVRSMQGAAFDSAFVNAQVMGHQQVLDLLQRSQSQAQNAGVQQHLTAAMKDVQSHLERAQQLQQSLMSGGAAGDTTMKGKADTTRKGKADTTRPG
jgi:putative membrane protein